MLNPNFFLNIGVVLQKNFRRQFKWRLGYFGKILLQLTPPQSPPSSPQQLTVVFLRFRHRNKVSSMVNYAISSSSSAHEEEEMLMPPPPGYHFVPSHTQIIEIYLRNKILGHPLSSNMIKEMDWMQQLDPEQLPFDEFTYCRKNEAYFITPTKERNTEGSRTILTTTSGYWKASKDEVPVFNSERIVGYKKTYVFYQGNEPEGEKTLWRMNEYRVSPDIIPADVLDDDVYSKIEQFVACKIRYKKPESPTEPLQEEPLKEEEEEEEDDEQEE